MSRRQLADNACAADADGKRGMTVLVHNANLGRPALERGLADLVVAGHCTSGRRGPR